MVNKTSQQHFNLPIILTNSIMLVLLAVVAITGVTGINKISTSNSIAINRRIQMADIRSMQLLLKNMDNNQINYIFNGDPVDAQAFKNAIAPLLSYREKISQSIETDDDRLTMNIIIRQTNQYIALFTDQIVPARMNNDADALNNLKAESDELISQIDPFIQNLLANYEKKAQNASATALKTMQQTVLIIIILSILMLVIGFSTGIGLVKVISNSTKQIILTSEQLQRSESALKKSERFLASIIENIPNMVFVKEAPDLIYDRFNRTGEEILGMEPGFAKGKTDYDFFPKEMADFYRLKDLEVLRSKKLIDIPEEPIQTMNGIRIYHTKKIPILDEEGNPKFLLGISEDITDRKIAEDQIKQLNTDLELRVEQRTAQLESSNKELEAFSYSISHDLRAPLRAINGYAQLIKEDYAQGLSPEAVNYFDLIGKNAIVMGQLVDDLLNFSRLGRQALTKSVIDPVTIVNGIIESFQPEQANRKINFIVQNLPTCNADPAFLKQVYVNLISNAVKFSKDKTESIVEIGFKLEDHEATPQKEGKKKVIYFVRDNGVGFDMKYYDKLFGVFQRLHSADSYEGTGVGLAIVSRIVTKHGGKVWAESEPENGATFYFTLEE